ncbi:MAG TPA: chaperone modulator CbpM [Sphingobacterium sp.]|jgi:chaperone modulatory protein CbpM|nr:chaperone modulator CbpM [Sphingobacterium sp.]
MERTLIRIIDVCQSHKIELQFIRNLSRNGLIEVVIQNEEEFVKEEELKALEQFATWHYDLEINLQGIEVAHHLLHKIEQLQEEIRLLRMEIQQ